MSGVRVGEWSGVEQRKHKRAPLHVPIECSFGGRTVTAQAENISISGLLVRCDTTFAQDSEGSVTWTLPGLAEPIRSQARVAHEVPEQFMGLEFFGLSAADQEHIERFVAEAAVTPIRPR
jgi:c-di-GMP-binding flagellar brake protein YcgR